MQSFDYTTLVAVVAELQREWLPARIEQVYQSDRHTLALALRTLSGRGWLTLSWHPQGARLHLGDAPPRSPDTFTLSEQLRHQLKGLALISLEPVCPWERVVDLAFGTRPGDPPQYHLYLEIMGKYSNLVLTDAAGAIITTGHQVNAQQSSVRTVQTGQTYQAPPALTQAIPHRAEGSDRWRERIALIPGPLHKQMLATYRGVSPSLIAALGDRSDLDPQTPTDRLTEDQWARLWECWCDWLTDLEQKTFAPRPTAQGYALWGGELGRSVQALINRYYSDRLNQRRFQELQHQLRQRVQQGLKKLDQKAQGFCQRLTESADADRYRLWGDLLMTYAHQWQPGMTAMTLENFDDGSPLTLPLQPDKNAIQNAQAWYKQHQKLKRAREAVVPLLATVEKEIAYLRQVQDSIEQLEKYQEPGDLETLQEIREELSQQGYLPQTPGKKIPNPEIRPHIYPNPGGGEVWVGRNNRQNDHLTHRLAGEYDLWFHTQEIASSHVLLRLPPGQPASATDLQWAADLTAYHSQGRHSEQVPVVYVDPKYVWKPKGSPPGMVIYQRETVIWGKPSRVLEYLESLNKAP